MRYLFLISLIPICLFANLEDQIKQRIKECRDVCANINLQDSNDIYTFYYMLGLQNAYTDCLEMIMKENCKR